MGTNQTTKETRRASYDAVIPKVKERSRLILETLGSRSMTVSEITDELVKAGRIPYGFEDTVLNKVAICKTLKDAGISDTDKGVLIQMEDGSEFQLIIKQTAKYDPAYYERPDTPIH